jgi:hypothetical protein
LEGNPVLCYIACLLLAAAPGRKECNARQQNNKKDRELDRTFRRTAIQQAARAAIDQKAAQAYKLIVHVLSPKALENFQKEVIKHGGDPAAAIFLLFVEHLLANPVEQAQADIPEPVRRPRKNAVAVDVPGQMTIFEETAPLAVSEVTPPAPATVQPVPPLRSPKRKALMS